MIQSRVRSDLERVKEIPFFPVIPLVPLALVIGSLAMTGILLWRVNRLTRLLEARA